MLLESSDMTLPPTASVADLMSSEPVMIDSRMSVYAAQRVAASRGVHHLLIVEEGQLWSVLCVCDLEVARPRDCVRELAPRPTLTVSAALDAAEAAKTMLESGIGCLPALGDDGRVIGVLTHRDLRRAGLLPGERGVDLCASCGDSHHLLRRPDWDGPVFCALCRAEAPRGSSVDSLYFTLGGSE